MRQKRPDGQEVRSERACLAFLLPTYKRPTMCAELLKTAHASGLYTGCTFVVLLDSNDTSLPAYRACVEHLHNDGMDVGYVVNDGTPYAGTVNRISHVVDADAICVLDSTHLPMPNKGKMGDVVRKWLSGSIETMRLGVFDKTGSYPVFTQKMIERLGYVYHPLCIGRKEAEMWAVSIAANIGVLSYIPDCTIIVSNVDGEELLGYCDPETSKWTQSVLEQVLPSECSRLSTLVVQ